MELLLTLLHLPRRSMAARWACAITWREEWASDGLRRLGLANFGEPPPPLLRPPCKQDGSFATTSSNARTGASP